jgi:putative iron-regulated protein
MDEGLVDYVADGYVYDSGNPFAQRNLIADSVNLDVALLRDMHEGAGAEANVATGYHVIEFLLWGQDLNLTKTSAGTRSYLDFSESECSSVHCDRRAIYLMESVELLLADLAEMVQQWQPGQGDYAKIFMALAVDTRLQRMLFGLGSLAYGELAGERIRVAMLAQSQEDEQSCFSDMTHFAIKENVDAVADVFNGIIQAKGQRFAGPSLSDLLLAKDSGKHQALMLAFTKAQSTVDKVAQQAKNGLPFDQQILLENVQAYSTLEMLIEQLREQAILLESINSQQLAMVSTMQ